MDNKERLEEIKSFVNAADRDFCVEVFDIEIKGESVIDDAKWLINRVEELQEEYFYLKNIHNVTAKASNMTVKERDCYKQALEEIRNVGLEEDKDKHGFYYKYYSPSPESHEKCISLAGQALKEGESE